MLQTSWENIFRASMLRISVWSEMKEQKLIEVSAALEKTKTLKRISGAKIHKYFRKRQANVWKFNVLNQLLRMKKTNKNKLNYLHFLFFLLQFKAFLMFFQIIFRTLNKPLMDVDVSVRCFCNWSDFGEGQIYYPDGLAGSVFVKGQVLSHTHVHARTCRHRWKGVGEPIWWEKIRAETKSKRDFQEDEVVRWRKSVRSSNVFLLWKKSHKENVYRKCLNLWFKKYIINY